MTLVELAFISCDPQINYLAPRIYCANSPTCLKCVILKNRYKSIHNSCRIIILLVLQLSQHLTGMTCYKIREWKKRTTALLCRQYFEFETRTHEFFIICCLPEFSITLAHFDTKDYTNPLMTFHPAHMYIGWKWW